jgi:hypothetical protein
MGKNKYISPSCDVYEIHSQGFFAKSPGTVNVDDLPTIGNGGTYKGTTPVSADSKGNDWE